MSARDYEVLRTLAWLAPLTSGQLGRIVAPGMRVIDFRARVVNPLARAGLIELVRYAATVGVGHRLPERRVPPRAIGKVWRLSADGFREIAHREGAPMQPAVVRQSVLDHDLMLSEVVTRVIEWTRPILSSIYVEHEERLDESRRRPVADAMLVVRYDASGVVPGVPWKSMPPAPDEHVRLYAIEVDRGTEEYRITDDKAVNYRRVRNDPSFYERYGRMFPVLLVTVPSEARLTRWHAGWKERWPYGKWLITTDTRLARDEWFEHDNGAERWRTFVDGWQPAPTVTPVPEIAHTDAAPAPSTADVSPDTSPLPAASPLGGWWASRLQGLEGQKEVRRRRG